MKIEKLMDTMHVLEKLKCNTRHSYTSSGREESVAEHCFCLALFAYFMKDEFSGADMDKVILMCLCHDIGEAFTGDIPSFLKKDEDEETEAREMDDMIRNLPEPFSRELKGLFYEMRECSTPEAMLFHALDKMEAVIQHNEADIETWIPLEYDLNLIYGEECCKHSEYLQDLRARLKKDSEEKIMQNKEKG